MKLFIATVIPFMLFVSSAFALDQHQCQTQCSQPPEIPFSWNRASNDFAGGVAPTFDQLLGTWTMVGIVNLPGLPEDGQFHADAYSPDPIDYIKNQDGSPLEPLVFFQQNAFDGNSDLLVRGLSVLRAEVYSAPVVARINSQESCFAFVLPSNLPSFSYNQNLSCRLLPSDANKMICAFVVVLPDTYAWRGSTWLPYDNAIIEYFAYTKDR